MQKWEYKTISVAVNLSAHLKIMRWELDVEDKQYRTEQDIMAYLNQLGSEGWEIVSICTGADTHGNITKILIFFKRPVPSGQ